MVNTVKFSEFAQASLANPTNSLVGVSSPSGGANIQVPFPFSWDTSTRPITPNSGTLGYNTSLGQLEYWNGIAWVQLASGGSGTVTIGAANEIAFYPAVGTTVNGLVTANNAGLFTDGSGVPSMVAATGTGAPVRNNSPTFIAPTLGDASATSIQFTSTDGIIGTNTNNNASIGSVGELVQSIKNGGAAIPILSNTDTDVTSIILHAGDWDIWGNVTFIAASPNVSTYAAWSSTTSMLIPDLSLVNFYNFTSGTATNLGLSIPNQRLSISGTTPLFLSAKIVFSTGSAVVCGGIYARVRR